jgi:hypothetical protein
LTIVNACVTAISDDDVIYMGETGPSVSSGLHFFDAILLHRILRADGTYIDKENIAIGDTGCFEFFTRFTNGEEIWLREAAFADDFGEYCVTYLDYCKLYGIVIF